MIEAPGWISSEVAGRSVVRSSRRVRIAGSGFGTCFRSFGFEFLDPAPPSPRGVLANATPRRFPLRLITRNVHPPCALKFEVGREGEVARLKWSKFFGLPTPPPLMPSGALRRHAPDLFTVQARAPLRPKSAVPALLLPAYHRWQGYDAGGPAAAA